LYVYGFVHPTSGRVEWLLLPTASTELFQLALEPFARTVGAGPKKRIALVLDRAGWQMSKELRVPDGIHLIPQPSYSPELQPSEHLWPLVREAVANADHQSMDVLEDKLMERCQQLSADRETIHQHTMFKWWKHAAKAERLSV
jgi:hypothetical protein